MGLGFRLSGVAQPTMKKDSKNTEEGTRSVECSIEYPPPPTNGEVGLLPRAQHLVAELLHFKLFWDNMIPSRTESVHFLCV